LMRGTASLHRVVSAVAHLGFVGKTALRGSQTAGSAPSEAKCKNGRVYIFRRFFAPRKPELRSLLFSIPSLATIRISYLEKIAGLRRVVPDPIWLMDHKKIFLKI
jgi:hypothetical protein